MTTKYNWENIQEDGFDNYVSLFEFIVRNYSVAQLSRDYKEQHNNYIETKDWVDKLYSFFEDEIHSHVTLEEANGLAAAQEVTGYDNIKKLHVNRALSLIVENIYQWNEKLFEKNPNKNINEIIDLDMLASWQNLSYENLSKHENLKNFIVNRNTGKDVISAINLINHDDSQIFVLGDAAKLLDVYTMDINSAENYEEYSNSVLKNLSELTIQMANASIRETYRIIYNEHRKEIINNPEKKLAVIVSEASKNNYPDYEK